MKWYSKLDAFRISDDLIDPERAAELTPYGSEVWPLLREVIYSSMLQRHSLPINPRAQTTSLSRLKGLLGPVSVTSLTKLLLSRRKENLFVSTDSSLREHDGGLVNIIVDPLRAQLPDSYLLEWQRDTSVVARRYQRRSLIAVGGLGFSAGSNQSQRSVPHYRNLYLLLKDNGLGEEYGYVEMCLKRYSRYLRIAASLLDVVKPKRLFLESGYGPKMRALLKIANRNQIETIECQHGSIHKYHPAFIFGNRDLTAAQQLLPRRLFVFGQHFKDVLDADSPQYSLGRVAILGYPFLDEVASGVQLRRPPRSPSDDDAPSILITSHNSYTSELLPFVSRLARMRPEVKFLYKLHPGERPGDEQFQKLDAIANIRVVSDYLISVYDLFAKCDVHVSVTSTCSFEALRFGIPSILVDLGDDSVPIAALVDNETCKSVPTDAATFFKVFDLFREERDSIRDACLKRSAYFFAPDYQVNLSRLLSS